LKSIFGDWRKKTNCDNGKEWKMASFNRRRYLQIGLSGGAAAFAGAVGLRAQDKEPSDAKLIDARTRRSINRGLSYLASRQNDDGSMRTVGYGGNVAVCSLTGMAFMSTGSTPGRGRYGLHVNRSVDFILDCVQPSGFISTTRTASHGPMYGHGFAALFLAEVYGMSPNPLVREKLTKAIQLIVNTQNEDGGWRYQPQRKDADISVTICQVMALRAARNAGVYVPNETIDRCIEYVKKCQNPDGGFMYMLSQPGDSRFPRSAAGVVALYSAGIYEGPELERGLAYLRRYPPSVVTSRRHGHFFYGHYYAVQAMWHAGGDDFKQWYGAIRDLLIERQDEENGSWNDEIAVEYGTAMACIVLQMPNSYLPIFQR
jgi:hypothetical protein